VSTQGRSSRGKAEGQSRRQKGHIDHISNATSKIIHEAGALLDEEMAIGIVAAKQMQRRFEKERRLDTADFQDALQRFQSDGHELVNLVDNQLAEFRTEENAELTRRLMSNVHDLLDLAVGLVGMGTEIANQLIAANLPAPTDQPKSSADRPKTSTAKPKPPRRT
jgi:hypothetical protein